MYLLEVIGTLMFMLLLPAALGEVLIRAAKMRTANFFAYYSLVAASVGVGIHTVLLSLYVVLSTSGPPRIDYYYPFREFGLLVIATVLIVFLLGKVLDLVARKYGFAQQLGPERSLSLLVPRTIIIGSLLLVGILLLFGVRYIDGGLF